VTVPDDLLWAWEAAYRRYGEASKVAASAISGDPNATHHMVSASREMAVAWRALEAVPDLPWWVLAAVSHAAQAFEFQAQDWNAQARRAWPLDIHGKQGPMRQLPTRPRPYPSAGGERR
jgi:hypothetical protein